MEAGPQQKRVRCAGQRKRHENFKEINVTFDVPFLFKRLKRRHDNASQDRFKNEENKIHSQ